MKDYEWKKIKYFNPKENFGMPSMMDFHLLLALDELRAHVGKPIVIHCGYEERITGFHPHGHAVDIHIEKLSLVDQFIEASRFIEFRGIGVYPYWNNPGLHLDNRFPNRNLNYPREIWGSPSPKKYVQLTKNFLCGG